MARGKYANRKANHEAQQTRDTVIALLAELDAEVAARAKAEAEAADVAALRLTLAALNTDRDAAVARRLEVLTGNATALAEVEAELHAASQAVSVAWDEARDALVDALGGGREGLEFLLHMFEMGGLYYSNDRDRRLGPMRSQLLQRARGERRLVMKVTDPAELDELNPGLLAPLLRPGVRNEYVRGGRGDVLTTVWHYGDDQATDVEVYDDPAPHLVIADNAVAKILRTSALGAGSDPDTLRAWFPNFWVNLIALDGRVLDDLGVHGEPASDVDAVPAAARSRWHARTIDEALAADVPELDRQRAIVRAAGRITNPWGVLPLFPRPADAVSLRYWHAMGSRGWWLRGVDEPNHYLVTGRDDLLSRSATVACSMANAVPFYVPPGQVADFAGSEPIAGEDIQDLRLPYPEVLLIPADPLVLPATRDPDQLETQQLAALDVGLRRLTARDDEPSIGDVLLAPAPDYWNAPMNLGALLAVRGANVEAVLLLADADGRLADTFAWCLAIPSGVPDALTCRMTLPARRSMTRWRDEIDNLAALAAWADWHAPDNGPISPPGAKAAQPLGGSRNHGGLLDAVRVLDVTATSGGVRTVSTGRTLRPHRRRGYWRRQHHGAGNQLLKMVRIAPVLVNAGHGELLPQIYRLPIEANTSVAVVKNLTTNSAY